MAKRDMVPLPAPYHCIYVEAQRYDWGVWVAYLAPSLELLRDAKCLTRAQLALLRRPSPGRSREDADGDSITRYKKPTKDQSRRILVVMYISSSDEKAMALPGVSKSLALESRDAPLAAKYSDAGEKTAFLLGSTGARDFQTRSRPVGRFQRAVEWTTIENLLIIPNWQKVKTDWMLQRAIDNTR